MYILQDQLIEHLAHPYGPEARSSISMNRRQDRLISSAKIHPNLDESYIKAYG